MLEKAVFRARPFGVSVALVACVLIASSGAAAAPHSPIGNGRVHVLLQDTDGKNIAKAQAESGKSNSAVLLVDRAYKPGDRIVFGGVKWMAVSVDSTIPECFVFAPHAASEDVSYEIPWGSEEKET